MKYALRVIAGYALWLASAALSLVVMLWCRLLLLIDIPLRLRGINPWALGALDKFGTFVFGVIWLIFLIVSEAYFRKFIRRKVTMFNVVKVFVVEGLLLGIVFAIRLLL